MLYLGLGCRTMDIFHVACAVEIGATEFLTFDRRQGSLAAHAGLKIGLDCWGASP